MLLVYVVLATNNFLAIGGTLAIIVFLGGKISGGSFNPAVTISLYAAGKLAKPDVIPYIIVEILGALAAVYAYKKVM
jgi:aquaporin Z